MGMFPPVNLQSWIEENRHLLKPPVGNKMVWKDTEFLIMVVGGPNCRKDFHIDPGEEFFYQVEGDIILRVMEGGKPRDIDIREGEIFLLPSLVPHSPQRPENTIGLVIERQRRDGEKDALRWYCERCHHLLHEAPFHLVDLSTQLKLLIENYYADEKLRTCAKCGDIQQPPAV